MPSFDRWRLARQIVAGLGIIVCACLVATGRHAGYALAVALALLPLGGFTFFARPYIFPYAVYVMLIPFDSLTTFSSFGTLSRLLGVISGFAMVLYALRTKSVVRPPVTVGLWGLYVMWAGATVAWALDPQPAIRVTGTLAQLFLLYAVLAVTPVARRDLRVIVGAVILGGIASGAFGAWTFHHQDPAMLAQEQYLHRLQIEVGDSSIDANHYADALLFPIIALTYFVLRERRVWRKLGMLLGVAIMITGVYYSASRESLFALVAALVFLGVVSRYRRQLVVVGCFLAGMSLAAPMMWVRMSDLTSRGGSGRFSIWETGLMAARHSWLAGTGVGTFPLAYDNAYINVFQRYSAGWSRPPHDIILQAFVELGAIGLILLALALLSQYRLLNDVAPGDELHDYRLILQASMIALMVAALFIDMVIYKYLWLVFGTMVQVYSVWRSERRIVPLAVALRARRVAAAPAPALSTSA